MSGLVDEQYNQKHVDSGPSLQGNQFSLSLWSALALQLHVPTVVHEFAFPLWTNQTSHTLVLWNQKHIPQNNEHKTHRSVNVQTPDQTTIYSQDKVTFISTDSGIGKGTWNSIHDTWLTWYRSQYDDTVIFGLHVITCNKSLFLKTHDFLKVHTYKSILYLHAQYVHN